MEEIRMKVRSNTVVAIATMAILKLISIIFETIVIVVTFNIKPKSIILSVADPGFPIGVAPIKERGAYTAPKTA